MQIVTTPFGRRPMTLGLIASQVAARDLDPTAEVQKWHVFNDVREGRDALGVTDRGLAILSALLSFHPETTLAGDGELVVFPSNEQLISRANGVSPATLRRHIAVLVSAGIIIRRDSPNGKRFSRKGEGGQIEVAFGFDLSPLVARAEEFKALAESVRAERRALRQARERLTICRRDIVKLIQAGLDEEVPADWRSYQADYAAILSRLPRTAGLPLLGDILAALEGLADAVRKTLENFLNSQNPSGNESHFERHIQNSTPDSVSEIESSYERQAEASGKAEADNVRPLPKRELPLGIVIDACPNIVWAVQGERIRTWPDLLVAAEAARPQLGISPSAWEEAKAVLGPADAAVTLAAIYQRVEEIANPGGYLRSLTDRAKDGKFSPVPMIMALVRAKLSERGSRAPAADVRGQGRAAEAPGRQRGQAG